MSNRSGRRKVRVGGALSIRSSMAIPLLTRLICLSILLGGAAHGQAAGERTSAAAGPVGQDKLAEIVNEVKAGNWASIDQIETEAGPVRAVPILRDLFANSQDKEVKERIAGALVKLGDKDGAYFDFMLVQATEAAESNMPFPLRLGSGESPIPKPQRENSQDNDAMLLQQLSPEFLAWAKSRGITVDPATFGSFFEESTSIVPGRLLLLAMTGDKRAIPVLRRGLSSPNFMIQTMAAQGLADLKDKDSIPLIIEACERAPEYAASAIAIFGLRSFDDPRAQSIAQSYLDKLQESERARSAKQDANLNPDQPQDSDQLKDADPPK